jgi:hypothetical protein
MKNDYPVWNEQGIAYAGQHGGCMMCDSTGEELAMNGHRPRCHSRYAHEPKRPLAWRKEKLLRRAEALLEQAIQLEKEAAELT